MHETINIPIGDDFAKMSQDEVRAFLLKEDQKLRKHAVETCKGQGLLEFQKANVEKQLATKYGMVEYNGVYVKVMTFRHIPQIFRNAIDKTEEVKEESVTEEKNEA